MPDVSRRLHRHKHLKPDVRRRLHRETDEGERCRDRDRIRGTEAQWLLLLLLICLREPRISNSMGKNEITFTRSVLDIYLSRVFDSEEVVRLIFVCFQNVRSSPSVLAARYFDEDFV